MYLLLFILGECFKLMIMGPVNMVVLPVMLVKFLWNGFRRVKFKNRMTEEEMMEQKRLAMVKKVNKKGFFTNGPGVMIKGRENLGQGQIVKMDYDPEYYAPYDVNPKELVLHVKYPGDNTHYFVNLNQLIK